MKDIRMLMVALMFLSTGAMADILKAPKCSALPETPNLICGEITDFCGPHFGACTGGSDCSGGAPEAGAIATPDDKCVAISITDASVAKFLHAYVWRTDTVCVQGEYSSLQTFVVTSACLK